MTRDITVAAYYFPNYHFDERNALTHGAGWNEWDLMRKARPRFPGHHQPKIPLWGYENEADPAVMARKIDAAADHGVDAFIFDWYYYNDGTFLEAALNDGFAKAPNRNRIRYGLMWANHNWVDIHPMPVDCESALLYPGAVTRETFDRMCRYVIERHFRDPSYWLIDGKPYFSIYEIFRLAEGLGSWEAVAEALENFRGMVRAAGFPDLHLNAVIWGVRLLPGEKTLEDPTEIVRLLKFDSVTSYVWVHHAQLKQFPVTEFDEIFQINREYWQQTALEYPVPYYPNVTMGWDASPRTVQSIPYVNVGYPMMSIMNTTPEKFRRALECARRFLDDGRRAADRIITVNAWNEWTEGSYLEPDLENGFAYLDAIRSVKA